MIIPYLFPFVKGLREIPPAHSVAAFVPCAKIKRPRKDTFFHMFLFLRTCLAKKPSPAPFRPLSPARRNRLLRGQSSRRDNKRMKIGRVDVKKGRAFLRGLLIHANDA